MVADRMRRVVLFRAHSQYGSVNRMVEELAAAFASHGVQPVVLDALADEFAGRLRRVLTDGGIGLLFSVNGIMLPQQGAGFYANVRAPVFTWMVDHPIYHPDRVRAAVPRLTVGVPSPAHVRFCERAYPEVAVVHMAHAAQPRTGRPWPDRDVPAIFSGSREGGASAAQRSAWQSSDARQARVFESAIEAHDADPARPLEEILGEITGFEVSDVAAIRPLFAVVDRYLRARLKEWGVAALAGTGAVVCGGGWQGTSDTLSGIRWLGSRSVDETLAWMDRACMTVNLVPPYYASHERVFQAMAAGSAAATSPSPLWADAFAGDAYIGLPYGATEMADAVPDLLADRTRLEAVAERGQRAFLAGHTWAHRVDQVLTWLAQDTVSDRAEAIQ